MKTRKTSVILTVALGLCFVACKKEELVVDEPQMQDGKLVYQTETEIPKPDYVEPKPDIKLENGSELFFMEVEGADAMLVVEGQDCEDCSALEYIQSIKGENVTDLEIFWAFSTPGTVMPEPLMKKQANVQISAAQGWAIKGLNESKPLAATKSSSVACNNSTFQSGTWYGGSPNYVRLDRKQSTHPNAFLSDCYNPAANGQCWGAPRYKYRAQYNGIKKWKGRICCKNVENAFNSHWVYYSINNGPTQSIYRGPYISFKRYYNGTWYTLTSNGSFAGYSIPANSTKRYTWHWISSVNQNFRIEARYAKKYDEFDFLMDK